MEASVIELELLSEALNRTDPAKQAAFLDEVCVGNPELRRRLELLLAGHARGRNPLDRPPPELEEFDKSTALVTGAHRPDEGSETRPHADINASTDAETGAHKPPTVATRENRLDRASATIDHSDSDPTIPGASNVFSSQTSGISEREEIGTVIADRYRLIEVIGEGGMGSVYLAEQSEPVKRQVALKLIKTGIDSRGVLARFDAERQALAMMDHPNIARIYDGGLTPSGQPFFVMELVQGEPLTSYCDQKRLPVKARLELFVAVCQAVQHAHQKGIIHRDLKPRNVLVTEVDGRPTPKVIDFGVAKATEVKLTDMSFADVGAIVGTPTYMSPEQADPSSMDIDTRSDVYALGVMLYELLTGAPPIDASQFKRGALLEMLRMVREVHPPRPSTKLSTADALPNIAANRSIEPARLSRLIQGELDCVVMKALEKDRTRRYDTANGFARDIQRYLADEVVEARPPSRGYRLRKFVKRNKIQVIAASLVLLALIGGVVGTSVGMVKANAAVAKERTANSKADLSRKRAEEREDLAIKAIDNYREVVETNPDLLTRPDLKPLRQNLLAAPAGFYRQLKEALDREMQDPDHPSGLEEKLMYANFSLAWLNAESGLQGDAARSYREAIAIMEPLSIRTKSSRARGSLAMIYNNLGNIHIELGEFDEARAAHEKGLKLRQDLAREIPTEDGPLSDLSYSEHNLGWLDSKLGRSEPAIAHYLKAVELREQVHGKSTERVGHGAQLAMSLNNLGFMLASVGRKDEALASYRRGIALLEEAVAAQPNVVSYRSNLAQILRSLGELLGLGEGRQAFARARTLGEAIVAEVPTVPRFRSDLATTLMLMGNLHRGWREFDQAIAVQTQAIAIAEALARDFPEPVQYRTDLANSLSHLGLTLVDAGRSAEAIPQFERAKGIYEELFRENSQDIGVASLEAGAGNNLSMALNKLGRHEEAIAAVREAIARQRLCLDRDPRSAQYRSWLSNHYQNIGKSLRALGRIDEADAASRERFSLLDAAPPELRDKAIHYHILCEMAQLVPLVGRGKADAELTEAERTRKRAFADRAIKEFRMAIADGFLDLGLFATDTDLDPIRDRADFQLLMLDAMDRAFPAWPFVDAKSSPTEEKK
ncbi:protein kinase domain-containing protein [Tundrisphaera lichenicola]|uniref:protein kinase domain-containing protein n=1 Tax=Tundrisphaera lichenicola TaxID=2029860 RepID=UPI003EB9AD2D